MTSCAVYYGKCPMKVIKLGTAWGRIVYSWHNQSVIYKFIVIKDLMNNQSEAMNDSKVYCSQYNFMNDNGSLLQPI